MRNISLLTSVSCITLNGLYYYYYYYEPAAFQECSCLCCHRYISMMDGLSWVFFEWKLSPGPSASIALYCGPGLQDRGTSLPHNFSTNSRLVIFEAVCYTTGIVMTTLTVQDSVSARRHAHFVKCFWLFYCFCCCLLLLS